MEIFRKISNTFWEVLESVTFAMALVVVSYLFFAQPGIVRGTSSYPTWKDNERFITEKISYYFGQPQRGDFVVIKSPQNPDVDFIKRIVGLPNEIILINSCNVYIDGGLLNETYLAQGVCTGPESFLKENVSFKIPGNSFFLLGDNRSGSSDSRDFGPIPRSSIVGKVIFRYWPPERMGLVPTE